VKNFPLVTIKILTNNIMRVPLFCFFKQAVKKPLMYKFIEEKIKSIITPKPPIGELTPTYDLRGTWVSSL